MKQYRVGVVSKGDGKVVVHKVSADAHHTNNTGGYNELRFSTEAGGITTRFVNWAWVKEVPAT